MDEYITKIIDNNKNDKMPVASVVIVTYNTNKKLLQQCLNSLKKQTIENFEMLIIDNSDKNSVQQVVSSYDLTYIKLKKNYGLSLARNVGISLSKGNIVIFLDDDAIPANNFVEEHVKAYGKWDIFGLRGKSLPRTTAIYNYLESHYDLGDQTIPWRINLEGNSSFKKEVLIAVGGFNPELQGAGGHEGLELTYKIVRKYQDKNKLIYYPEAIIYHDYSDSFKKYLNKRLRHDMHSNILERQYPELFKFKNEYKISQSELKRNDRSRFIQMKLTLILKLVSFLLRLQHTIKRLKTTDEKRT